MAIATSVTKSHENGDRNEGGAMALWHSGGGNPFVSGQRYICSAAGGRRGINWTNIVGDATSKSAYFKGFRGSSIRALARGTTIT